MEKFRKLFDIRGCHDNINGSCIQIKNNQLSTKKNKIQTFITVQYSTGNQILEKKALNLYSLDLNLLDRNSEEFSKTYIPSYYRNMKLPSNLFNLWLQ